jgi:hypothetical protein
VDYVVENENAAGIPSPSSQKMSRHDESDTDFQAQAHESDPETDIDSDISNLRPAQPTLEAGRKRKGSSPIKGIMHI